MIRVKNLTKIYSNNIKGLDDVSFEINDNEFVFITGHSGCGKTTLIKLLLKEIAPTNGEILVNGYNLNLIKPSQIPYYRRELGVVFQDFRLLHDRNVYENIFLAQKVIGVRKKEITSNITSVLSLVNLAQKYKVNPSKLSGGEQQRVGIARAIINNPKILLCDEPTGNLDEKTAWEVMDILNAANKRGTTVIVVTHNKEIVDTMKKRVIVLNRGKLVSDTNI